MRLDRKSMGVMLLCIGGAATGGTLLYHDMTGIGMNGEGAPIAQVLHTERRVKRKLASSYAWNTVKDEQQLFRKESIQTGPESAALIRLADGSTVEVRENSLIVIDETKNLMNSFMHGSLILHQESGDSVMTAGSDGKVQIHELPARLVSPALSQIFFTTKGTSAKIHFEWKLREGAALDRNTPLAVQISRDTSFQNKLTLTETTGELPAGRHYWRIIQQKEGQKEEVLSTIAPFSVLEAAPLTLIAPSEGERVEYYGDQATVEFRWVDQPGSQGKLRSASILAGTEHQLEISGDKTFRNILAAKRVAASSQSTRVKGVPSGMFYWRIRSKWGEVNGVSPTQSFRVERAERMSLELLAPSAKATLPEAPIRFSWRSDLRKLENRYSVEIESTTPGKKYSTVESTQAGGISISSLSPASYRWRVKATTQDEVTGESEWRDFNIARGGSLTLKFPFINQQIFYWHEPSAFKFQWEPDLLVTAEGSTSLYQLELSKEADFRNLVAKKQSRGDILNSSEIALRPGSYYWRLQVLDETGTALKTSAPFQFTYGVHPVLAAPASASPASETKLNPLEVETDPVLSWSSVEDAVTYEVVVTRQMKGVTKLWRRQVTVNTSITLQNAPEGIYLWSVRALDPLGRLGEPLPERKLILDAGDTLAPPKNFTREVQ